MVPDPRWLWTTITLQVPAKHGQSVFGLLHLHYICGSFRAILPDCLPNKEYKDEEQEN